MPEAGVIYTLVIFVDEYPRVSRVHKIALSSKGAERVSGRMRVISIQPRPVSWNSRDSTVAAWAALKTRAYCANSLIHGEAANSWQPRSDSHPRISRALVYFCTSTCVVGQNIVFGISHRSRIGRTWQGSRVAYYPDVSGGGGIGVFIRRQKVIMIRRVHSPADHHLFAVIHAQDSLCFSLVLRQSGQKQPGEDGDDRYDHQEFYEREAVAAHGFGWPTAICF